MHLNKPIFVALLTVTAALIPAGSALSWTPDGDHTISGGLVSTLPSGATLNCSNIDFEATLDAGVTGEVEDGAASNPCITNVSANCDVTVDLRRFDWEVWGNTATQDVTISNAEFSAVYSSNGGGACPLAGLTLVADGNVTAPYDDTTGDFTFSNTRGLSVEFSNNQAALQDGTPILLNGTVNDPDMPTLP